MKQLWLPVLLSLGIHTALFYLDMSWLKTSQPASPIRSRVTISIGNTPSSGRGTFSSTEKISETGTQGAGTSEKKKAVPSKKIEKQKTKKLTARKPAVQPAIVPLTPQSTMKKEPEENKKALERAVRPERNHKKPAIRTQETENTEKPGKGSFNETFQPEEEPDNQPANMPRSVRGDVSGSEGLFLAKPMYRKNPPPHYPKRARRKGYEGTVILEVQVDENGAVNDIKVSTSSGYKLLDESAVSSVYKWAFEPGTKGGFAAKMWVRVPIRFKLN